MQNSNAIHTSAPKARANVFFQLRKHLLRKLWLPRVVYEALPYLYILFGITALASAMYTPSWFWILPYVFLLGLVCLHTGLALAALRYKFRASRKSKQGEGKPKTS